MSGLSDNHPLARLFRELIHNAVVKHVASSGHDDTAAYMTRLLLEFMRTERMAAIRDNHGLPILSLAALKAAGDIRAEADSFEREREVHKHLGDFLLFTTGLYPELYNQLRRQAPDDLALNPVEQGAESYSIVASFDHGPWLDESATFKKLSDGFEDFSWVLAHVGKEAGLVRPGQA